MTDINDYEDDSSVDTNLPVGPSYGSDSEDEDEEYVRPPPPAGQEQDSDDEEGADDEDDDDDASLAPVSDSDEEGDEEDEQRFRKISRTMKENILQEYHTELKFRSSEEVQQMAQVIRNIHGEIVDPFHRTIPLLTKYERARVLGERARQLEEGAEPFVPVPAEVIDSYTIAEMELKEKAIPFIIERPLPHGGCEFWRLCDLETM
jgi:DNA-directed RNA polymerase subunit K/omega